MSSGSQARRGPKRRTLPFILSVPVKGYPWIIELFDYSRRGIRAPVINNDELHVTGISRSQYLANCLCDSLLFIERAHKDRYFRAHKPRRPDGRCHNSRGSGVERRIEQPGKIGSFVSCRFSRARKAIWHRLRDLAICCRARVPCTVGGRQPSTPPFLGLLPEPSVISDANGVHAQWTQAKGRLTAKRS